MNWSRALLVFLGPFFTDGKENHRSLEIRKYIECPKCVSINRCIIKSLWKNFLYNWVSCVLQKFRRVERFDESAALQRDGILRPLLIQGHLRISNRQSRSLLRSRQFRRHRRRISEGSAALQQQRKRDVR